LVFVGQASSRGERHRLAQQLRADGRTWAEIAEILRGQLSVSARAAMRLAHGWTQQRAADEWELRWPDKPKEKKWFSYQERWPNGGRAPSLADLNKLAQLYQCAVTDLLTDLDYGDLDPLANRQASASSAKRASASQSVLAASGRKFFGQGPVTIAIPLRKVAGRSLPVISSEDALAARRLARFLDRLGIKSDELRIPPHGVWEPPLGDLVVICGPLSSPVTAEALRSDPFLAFEPDDQGRWHVHTRGPQPVLFRSPMTADGSSPSDVAYIGRILFGDRTALLVAGIHALGSVGAVDYLTKHLAELHERVGEDRFSMAVASEHDNEAVISTTELCQPRMHPLVTTAERPAASQPSQDRIFTIPNAVIVLDGASHPDPTPRDGGWMAEQIGHQVHARLSNDPQVELTVAVADAIATAARTHVLAPGTSPSTTISIARWDHDTVDVLVLCDSPVVVIDKAGNVHEVTDDRLRDVTGQVDRPAGYLTDPDGWRAIVAHQQQHRNTPDGYWVAEANPDAAYHAVTRSWPLDEVTAVMVMTDGVSKAVDTYGIWPTWLDAYELARHNPATFIDTIHDAEHGDPDGTRWPRSKRHDDKALAVITLTAAPAP
jgi:transcriptional regulator with XRE-family HTH domain